MLEYSLSHVRDGELLRNAKTKSADETGETAHVLAHIAEIDKRRLYRQAGYPSMHSYCVHELKRSPQSAYKRIRAARLALQYPRIFPAVAAQRLGITGIGILSPHLTPENAEELLDAAEGRTDKEIEQLIATRFPRPALPEVVRPLTGSPEQLSVRRVEGEQLSVRRVEDQPAPTAVRPAEPSVPGPRIFPLSAEWSGLQLTIHQDTLEKLHYAQALLGHRVSRRDLAKVLDRALDALISRLEKQKFGATSRPRPARPRQSDNPRYIPLSVRREVWERDRGQCTFVSENGRRCPECSGLEFDHVLEVARGGGVSAAQIRLRCRAHNQYGAECTFGTDFMNAKRAQAKERAAARRAEHEEARKTAADAGADEIIPALRELGFRAEESRRAAAFSASSPAASLEARVKLALSYLCPKRPSATAFSAAAAGSS